MPHIIKYAHVLLDFYEDSGLSPEEFKVISLLNLHNFLNAIIFVFQNVTYELVNDFRLVSR